MLNTCARSRLSEHDQSIHDQLCRQLLAIAQTEYTAAECATALTDLREAYTLAQLTRQRDSYLISGLMGCITDLMFATSGFASHSQQLAKLESVQITLLFQLKRLRRHDYAN